MLPPSMLWKPLSLTERSVLDAWRQLYRLSPLTCVPYGGDLCHVGAEDGVVKLARLGDQGEVRSVSVF